MGWFAGSMYAYMAYMECLGIVVGGRVIVDGCLHIVSRVEVLLREARSRTLVSWTRKQDVG